MPRKSSRRKRRSIPGWFGPLILIALAIAIGWVISRPLRHHHHIPTETATASPASIVPAETETPSALATVAASSTPSITPSAIATASAAVAPNPSGPKLALIVDDCGQWLDTERGFIALPIPLTLSVLPHVRYGTTIANEASAAGKGVMLHLPMDTLSGLYPGPGEITTAMTGDQIVAQLNDDLAQVPLAAGVNNHEGSKGSADSRVMHAVIGVLAKRGNLFFIDSRTNAASVAEGEARAQGVPTAARNVFLDNTETVAYTEGQLREAAAIAKRTGSAIMIGHPRPTTLEAVRALYPEFQAEGITFVLAQTLTH